LHLFPSILKNPTIIADLLTRKNTLLNNRVKKKYIVEEGAGGEYWAWLPEDKSALYSGVLRQAWLNILFEFGCKVVRYEKLWQRFNWVIKIARKFITRVG